MNVFNTHIHYISNKAYRMLLSDRPYETEIRRCDCYMQDCKGRFLAKVGSEQEICFGELNRIYHKNYIQPVLDIIEQRITI